MIYHNLTPYAGLYHLVPHEGLPHLVPGARYE